ncbi:hypothetical protein PoB_004062800 [Plakobranchus ocellatus]|uniref:Uncharacterized protein n=1 Tax=Plakobranchus ocellatus TaxID=259542 RepID=A0AAV4B3G9_9GAST|nr:hypothetical protein PoB_004062800 [Plakobranchus ocellatus]
MLTPCFASPAFMRSSLTHLIHNPVHNTLSQAFRPPSSQVAGGGARTRDRRIPADIRADSLATVPPTPPCDVTAKSLTQVPPTVNGHYITLPAQWMANLPHDLQGPCRVRAPPPAPWLGGNPKSLRSPCS